MSCEGPKTARRRRHTSVFASLCGLFHAMAIWLAGSGGAYSEAFPYEDAVSYCRGNVERPLALNEDHTILCFDGVIATDLNLESVGSLEENGLFVIRSPGGIAPAAIALAERVRDRHAVVVVYDYCVSACAAYVLIAADQTFVRRDSIVAWHHTYMDDDGEPDCFEERPSDDGGPKILQTMLCSDQPAEIRSRYARFEAQSRRFMEQRTLNPSRFGRGFDFPQSIHVRRALRNMLGARGRFPLAVWLLHPRYYKTLFKTTITYQAYPEGQDEVDDMAKRFGFRNVIYDP